jgi:hypothetical protein
MKPERRKVELTARRDGRIVQLPDKVTSRL